MNKNKLAGVALLALGVIASAVTVSSGNVKHILSNASSHGSLCQWNHYAAINPTESTSGVREYWICCDHHTLGPVFEKPTEGNISDATHPSGFASTLSESDPRYLKPYSEIIDFEDGSVPSFITGNSGNSATEVVTIDGTKVLRTTAKGWGHGFNISKTFLDVLFSDYNVVAVSFDAKATIKTNDFRRRGQGTNICYEKNASNYGISTEWKTFYYTREYYNKWQSDDIFVLCGNSTAGSYMYFDNIKPVTHWNDASFDTGYMNHQSSNTVIAYTGGHDAGSSTDSTYLSIPYFKTNSSTISSISLSEEHASDGRHSMKITKGKDFAAFYTTTEVLDMIGNNSVSFDLYSTIGANASVGNFSVGTEVHMPRSHPANKWVTYTITKDQITEDGRFLILNGSTQGDWYFDNFKINETIHSDFCSYTHYAAVSASLFNPGVKEYWECDVHTNSYFFEKPDNTISGVHEGTHEAGFASTLNPSDSRYVAPWGTEFTFEDGNIPEVITGNSGNGSTEVVYTDSYNGFYALKVTGKSWGYGINLKKAFLDEIFSDPEVNAISFQAKSNYQTNDFRRQSKGVNITYEKNATGYGIDTHWKTFYYTREYYNNSSANDIFVINGSIQAGQEDRYMLFDNIKPVYEELTDFGFENGVWSISNTSASVTSGGHSKGSSNDTEVGSYRYFYYNGVNNLTYAGITTELSSQGINSFKVTKTNGYTAFYLSADFYNMVSGGGYVEVDVYSTVTVNGFYVSDTDKVLNFIDGKNNPTLCSEHGRKYHPSGQWVTYTFDASQLSTDGRFLIIQGSSAGDWYFDNIRVVKNA